MRIAVAALQIPGGVADHPVTVSAGVAVAAPGGIVNPGELVAEADAALYAAKRGGRNRVHQADSASAPARCAGFAEPEGYA